MENLAALAAVVVTLGAAAIAVFSAEFTRRQAVATQEQAKAAHQQADIAREQAAAAREQVDAACAQVAEAKRANDLAEAAWAERTARSAVTWVARLQPSQNRVLVYNEGHRTALNVTVQEGGADEDWEHLDQDDISAEEVRSGDYVAFGYGGSSAPHQLYVDWDGASHPNAVRVLPKNG